MSKLVLLLADGTTLDIPLDRERLTIGRRTDNDLYLPNLAVSGEHAAVITILSDSFLEDVGSTNGTLVNGKPITRHFLRNRDQIDIGRHRLIYCVDDNAVVEGEVASVPDYDAAAQLERRVESARSILRIKPSTVFRTKAAPASAAERTAPSPVRVPIGSGTSEEAPLLASIKVLSGTNAGRTILLDKPQLTIGRPGVQVAAIVRNGASWRLKLIKGEPAPAVNGQPVSGDGVDLAPGDVIEIAGIKLEFVLPGEA